jgi:hypothetical protein
MRRNVMRSSATFASMLLLGQLCLAGDCVDGVTPDCSDAATQCGPNLDGTTVDGASPTDASNDASIDAAPDASDQ